MININGYIGKKIKERRKTLGITQEVLSEYLGCSRVNLVHIETGKTSIQPTHLYKICCALNCKPDFLFPETKEVKRKTVNKSMVIIERRVTTFPKIISLKQIK